MPHLIPTVDLGFFFNFIVGYLFLIQNSVKIFLNVMVIAVTELKLTFYGVFLESPPKQQIASSRGCH